MKTFEKVKFDGTFRSYQQTVLDNVKKHLADKKVHIVAAPGSGKTILGLELIRRLNAPALVFSPSVTIRQQWGERFAGKFLPEEENGEDYLSFDLKNPSLITSVTYQALHAAYNKSVMKEEKDSDTDDSGTDEKETEEDFSGFDLIKTMQTNGITTVCLDEAHHLRSEWQKALEEFIKKLGKDVTVIALTATPPYDSNAGEWNRYSEICGPIDDEIFVPQLVGQKTLCPHQDYIHFSYPTDEELAALKEYDERAEKCAAAIINGTLYDELLQRSALLTDYAQMEEIILDNEKGVRAFLSIAAKKGKVLPKALLELISCKKGFPPVDKALIQTAFQFVLDNEDIFTEESADKLRKTLSADGLVEKRRVALASSDKLNKMLLSSMGKLESIKQIAAAETKQLGDKLRMLVLTDFIKKDMVKIIGTDEAITSMGTVPVFEAIRRTADSSTKIGVLSGGLVIVPTSITDEIGQLAQDKVKISAKPLGETGYSELIVSGSNKNKVAVITDAFGKGLLNILVGTKALLGEGWDSPCINSLILASFVGSFMLSNQMRGRAIRTDYNVPDKTSNIWHLTTILPDADKKEPDGADWETLKRRFDCFIAPAYSRDSIESGIDRIDIINPPFTKENITNINNKMFALAADRPSMAEKWNAAVTDSGRHSAVTDEVEVDASVKPVSAIISNTLLMIFLTILCVAAVIGFSLLPTDNLFIRICGVVVGIVLLITYLTNLNKLLRFLSPARNVKTLVRAVFNTLCDMGEITSKKAKLSVTTCNCGSKRTINCSVIGTTAHESSVFSTAISELLSPIDDPRYIIAAKKKNGFNFRMSYACPSIIGANKENAEKLALALKKNGIRYGTVFTRSQEGKKSLLSAKKYSYLNRSAKVLNSKRVAKTI